MQIRLIVGLGNPGPEYIRTRHNVGFMVVDHLADAACVKFRHEKAWKADVARIDGVQLLKPLTYMNLSGESVQAAARFFKVDSGEVLVILDDLALPLGKLRFRGSGGSGGHRGLQSVLQCLGTQSVPRLRVGIGAPQSSSENAGACEGSSSPQDDAGVVGHVLGRFTTREYQELPAILRSAKDAIECACQRGLTAAMNQYN
jgi:PTH1 family peptidyl-tRNA hydrolase